MVDVLKKKQTITSTALRLDTFRLIKNIKSVLWFKNLREI